MFLSPANRAKVNQIIDEKFTCNHKEAALTLQTRKNNARFYRSQCRNCGEIVKQLSAADLSEEQKQAAIEFDPSIQGGFWRRKNAEYARLEVQYGEEERKAFVDQYNGYLASPEWKRKRELVLERDSYLCQGCRSNRATQVHHLSYKRVFEELLFDLIAVCDSCHKRIHLTVEQLWDQQVS